MKGCEKAGDNQPTVQGSPDFSVENRSNGGWKHKGRRSQLLW